MDDLDTLKAKWIAAEQAAYDAWSAVSRLPLWKEHRQLRKQAKEAKERFRSAWHAQMQTNESTNNAQSEN